MFVVTGDVASARKSLFRDGLPFDEQLLTIPLYVHFPGGRHAGAGTCAPSSRASDRRAPGDFADQSVHVQTVTQVAVAVQTVR